MQQFPTKKLTMPSTTAVNPGGTQQPQPRQQPQQPRRQPHPGMPGNKADATPVLTGEALDRAARQAVTVGRSPDVQVSSWSFQATTQGTGTTAPEPAEVPAAPSAPSALTSQQVTQGVAPAPSGAAYQEPSHASKGHPSSLRGFEPQNGETPVDAKRRSLTQAETNPNFYSVDLPSKFLLYRGAGGGPALTHLSASVVRGRHQAKFSRAAQEKNSRYLVEGVTSLLGDGVSALDLTTGDFYWLLYWLLLASYPVRSRALTYTCSNEAHLDAVESGALPEESLRTLITYDKPKLKETVLDEEKLRSLDLTPLNGLPLGGFLVKDLLEWEATHEESATAEDFAIYDLALYLAEGTLEERAEIVRDFTIEQMDALTAYKNVAGDHGVVATLKCVCKECSAETEVNLSVSARDFL